MTFVNLSLLAGSALVVVPIVLHLVMRRKPKLMEFPALRFVRKRHETNQRRMKLRHLLLLLLRMGVIALLAFALARPSMQFSGAIGSQEAPVAAAFVVDVAERMNYKRDNQTRLQAAKELAGWLLSQLPAESEIAVLDARSLEAGVFQSDRGAAKSRLERLEAAPNAQPLAVAAAEAARLLKTSRLERKELYVLTDRSRGAWPEAKTSDVAAKFADLPGVTIYVLDVGVKDPADFALGELRLSGNVLSQRSALKLRTEIASQGISGARSVELHLLDKDGVPQKRGAESAELKPGEAKALDFRVGALDVGVHQGYVKIVGQDALPDDDARYFTVEVRPPWRVLIAAPNPTDEYAVFLAEALAPAAFRKQGQARFDCETAAWNELGKKDLKDYSAVFVLDPDPAEPTVWQKLADFAADGHGVAVCLGRNARPLDSFNASAAQQVLPGKLLRQVPRREGDLRFDTRNLQHPVLRAFGEVGGTIPWDMFPVFRYWEFDALKSGSSAIVSYNDGRPAIIERPIGSGRVVILTTPISDRPNQSPWNLLPTGDAWPFVILMNQLTTYLVGNNDEPLNFSSGQLVTLPVESEPRPSYLMTGPGKISLPVTPDAQLRQLTIASAELPGNYRVRAGGTEGGFDRGFSVNITAEQTRLDRADDKQIGAFFAPHSVRFAQTREQVDREISVGRVGRELYPALILALVAFLALESLIANRFYAKDVAQESKSSNP